VAAAAGGLHAGCGAKRWKRRAALSAIRHNIIDDCALGRAMKAQGGRFWLGLDRTGAVQLAAL